MTGSRRRRSRAGYLLLDILCAFALLAGGVLVTLVFLRTEVADMRINQERMAAKLIAESEIERLCAASYEAIPTGASIRLNISLPSYAQLGDSPEARLTVVEIGPGLKKATVRVSWLTRRRTPMLVEFTRLFAREGRP